MLRLRGANRRSASSRASARRPTSTAAAARQPCATPSGSPRTTARPSPSRRSGRGSSRRTSARCRSGAPRRTRSCRPRRARNSAEYTTATQVMRARRAPLDPAQMSASTAARRAACRSPSTDRSRRPANAGAISGRDPERVERPAAHRREHQSGRRAACAPPTLQAAADDEVDARRATAARPASAAAPMRSSPDARARPDAMSTGVAASDQRALATLVRASPPMKQY